MQARHSSAPTRAELETPRITTCSFYPYSLNENGEVVLLLRNKKDSKNAPYYVDFGSTYRENDGNIIYTAVRSYLNKTAGGLCLASELETLATPSELEKKLKEFTAKASNEYEWLHGKKQQEILHTFFYHNTHMVIQLVDTHAAFFYPLPYFKLETINKVFVESERFADVSLHWISLKMMGEVEFTSKYITAFDLQLIQ